MCADSSKNHSNNNNNNNNTNSNINNNNEIKHKQRSISQSRSRSCSSNKNNRKKKTIHMQQQQKLPLHIYKQNQRHQLKSLTTRTASTSAASPSTSSFRTTSLSAHKSAHKWKIIITSIIFLLCRSSHVLALRKGRLMSPSSFTALSGDLHVQIQFNGENVANITTITGIGVPGLNGVYNERNVTATKAKGMSALSTTTHKQFTTTQTVDTASLFIENIITSTLVISRYIDEEEYEFSATTAATPSASTSTSKPSLAASKKTKKTSSSSLPTLSKTSSKVSAAAAAASSVASSVASSTSFWASTHNNASFKITSTAFMATSQQNNEDKLLKQKRKEIVQNIQLFPDPRNNVTQITVPCQTFVRGGLYEMQVVTNLRTTSHLPRNSPTSTSSSSSSSSSSTTGNVNSKEITPTITTTTLMPLIDERLRQTLDVRWPVGYIKINPIRLLTYPDHPVEVNLRFPNVNCENARHNTNSPEFWLELIYCGKELKCEQLVPQNTTKSHILYAEQVRGFPKEKNLTLGCELFGLAGNYAVQLRPMIMSMKVPLLRAFLSVDWSDKFVFNVYARSVFPCDPHTGIGVLFEYPGCILEQGDRVRVYGKLRADVASLKPPTTLHYVAEHKIIKPQHSLYFDCELFSEKYVEYCFVYVSQAISGAVADVRMDCVPTLPVSDSDSGGWGPWSEWSACTTNCLGGTRSRYRFCDSPPPRYGAKFCEGSAVETQKCGNAVKDTWDCIYESNSAIPKENRTNVKAEIGPGCRCGCIVHLGSSKPKRVIAGSTQSCPGRSFWLIQVDDDEHIQLSLDFVRLPCATQYIKVRDGHSLASNLLIELNGGNNFDLPAQMESSGAQLLVEFYAGDEMNGATLTNIIDNNFQTFMQMRNSSNNNKLRVEFVADNDDDAVTPTVEGGAATAAAAAAVAEAGVAQTTSSTNLACTGGFVANILQMDKNATKIKATMLAATGLSVKSRTILQNQSNSSEKYLTLVHISVLIFAGIVILISALLGVQYLVRYHKYDLAIAKRRDEGSRLHTPRDSITSLNNPPSRAMSTTTLISEVIYMVKMRPKRQLRHSILRESIDGENLAKETEIDEHNGIVKLVKCSENLGSNGSIVTLRNEIISPLTESVSQSPSLEDIAETSRNKNSVSPSDTLTRKDSAKDSESIISSGMSSIYNSPPMNLKRLSRYSDRYDMVTLKIRNSRLDDSITDCESLRSSCMRDYERVSHLGSRSGSISLTNGYYSPAVSLVSRAKIRNTTNPKESKEKQNLKKLLARPGSEFSLGTQEDLEMDYYDYNVINAGAAPGSYLGMDPAYLVWIPPFEDVIDMEERDEEKTPEPDENEPLYEEIKIPKYTHYLSPGSNTESSATTTTNPAQDVTPTSDELSPLNSNFQSKATTPNEGNMRNFLMLRKRSNSSDSSTKQSTPHMMRKQRRQAKQQSKSTLSLGNKEMIPLTELNRKKSAHKIITTAIVTTRTPTPTPMPTTTLPTESPITVLPDSMNGSYVEKETRVVKSPSDLQNFLALDDIQFADEESDEEENGNDINEETKLTTTTATATIGTRDAKAMKRAEELEVLYAKVSPKMKSKKPLRAKRRESLTDVTIVQFHEMSV